MKIIILGQKRYADWCFGDYEEMPSLLGNVKEADLIIFTGGSDVDPSVYNHKKHYSTRSDIERDKSEYEMYSTAIKYGIPMLGICRGAQFLTACQPNGSLIQDVFNHALHSFHTIEFADGDELTITSTHHQMMYPFDVDNYELIAWSSPSRSGRYSYNDKILISLPEDKEPEVVFYPNTKCFCIQGHPENMSPYSPVSVKLKELITKKLFNA